MCRFVQQPLHNNALFIFGRLSGAVLAAVKNGVGTTGLMHRLGLRAFQSLSGTFVTKFRSSFVI